MRSIDEISQTNPEKPLLLKVDGKEYYRCPIHIRHALSQSASPS